MKKPNGLEPDENISIDTRIFFLQTNKLHIAEIRFKKVKMFKIEILLLKYF